MDESATSDTATDTTATTVTGTATANEASVQSVQGEDNIDPFPEDLIRARNRQETEELIAKLCPKYEDPDMRDHIRLDEYGRGTEAIQKRFK